MPTMLLSLVMALFTPVLAWMGSTSLVKRGNKSWGLIRASTRFGIWTFAFIILRDHVVRATHRDPTTNGTPETLAAIFGLGFLCLSLMNVERITASGLGLKRKSRNTEFLAGLGIGFLIATLLIEFGLLQRICLIPSVSVLLRLTFAFTLSFTQVLVFQALVPALTKKALPTTVALTLAAAAATFSWLPLAVAGPLAFFNLLAFAGWSTLVATLAFYRYGFTGAVGASSALLFLLSRP